MSNEKKNTIFSALYCNRIKVNKGTTPILNLSLVFCLLAVLTAPWLAVGGVIVALVLGYKFGFERNAAAFNGNFDEVVKGAANNVRTVVNSVTDKFDGNNETTEATETVETAEATETTETTDIQ